ncbi:MAG: hypothetical protein AB1894_16900, partial [Chloroflexota bacterium]
RRARLNGQTRPYRGGRGRVVLVEARRRPEGVTAGEAGAAEWADPPLRGCVRNGGGGGGSSWWRRGAGKRG